MKKSDIGLIGLAVMGENLVLNMESKGFTVSVYNRTVLKVDTFINSKAKGKNIFGAHSLEEFVHSLESPRKIMLMIKAGEAVDKTIEELIPFLSPGDIIIDGGNSHYEDTERRTLYVESKGLFYIGTGVSGGEEGALKGPSMMPGGSHEAWEKVKPIFTSICAKTDSGEPCCDWVGKGGAGHFVKMVHNGIEYGDMQLICEVYHFMKNLMNFSAEDIHRVFSEWKSTELDSYLIDITTDIFTVKDEDGSPLVEKILDSAGQKGTGKWTSVTALDEGVPVTLISEAVFARYLSAMKSERVEASKELSGPYVEFKGETQEYIDRLRKALYCAKIISYAQGFSLMKAVSEKKNWGLDYGNIALMWRGGCIIRSVFLDKIKEAFNKRPDLTNLMLDPYFKNEILDGIESLRKVCAVSMLNGISVPSLAAALTYFDGYRSEKLPANLLQAQRDYFGAHTYERTDFPKGKNFHTNWK
ncbi:MAG: decarboxylating NADP(+)-dependent phosphogluconate dehydrogenase [Clostridia bacterium]|nr:decarboxylating NADP(+)-dependent phosphogluconate dehydrogenase [Clostridia bacterium]